MTRAAFRSVSLFVFLGLLALVGACGSDARSVLGTWFVDFGPDGEQFCLIYCDGGRVFVGDSLCTETDRSDFSAYSTYVVDGDQVVISDSEGEVITLTTTVDGDSMTIAAPEFGEFNEDYPGPFVMMRTAPSPLCDDTSIPAR